MTLFYATASVFIKALFLYADPDPSIIFKE
jgi:hypothetical protein